MQAQSLSLRHKLQGALPLIDHFLRALDLRALIAQQSHLQQYDVALELLVKCVLLSHNALYRIEAWA